MINQFDSISYLFNGRFDDSEKFEPKLSVDVSRIEKSSQRSSMMWSRRESPRNSWHLTWEFARLIGVEVLHERYLHSSWEAIESFAENSYSGKKWFPVWICEMISRPNRDTPDRNVSLEYPEKRHCCSCIVYVWILADSGVCPWGACRWPLAVWARGAIHSSVLNMGENVQLFWYVKLLCRLDWCRCTSLIIK